MTDERTPTQEAIVNLRTAHVALGAATDALRQVDTLSERDRREIVAWLDDSQTAINRTGQTYQRLNERSAQRPSIAVPGALTNGENPDGPTVILHEQGQGPRSS
jgi:hypothetical protein